MYQLCAANSIHPPTHHPRRLGSLSKGVELTQTCKRMIICIHSSNVIAAFRPRFFFKLQSLFHHRQQAGKYNLSIRATSDETEKCGENLPEASKKYYKIA